MAQAPVLLIIFNRPDATRKVFESIRRARPRQLFVAADGPRSHKEGEHQRCAEARAVINEVDWDCEVKTLFRTENRGCGRGPSEGISWFFDHVDYGIILEDDCLPAADFFPFCNELLEKYRDHENIYLISGSNYWQDKINTDSSYFFSRYAGIWGWATWKRAWKHYRFDLPDWKNKKTRSQFVSQLAPNEGKYISHEIGKILKGELEAWDYQWLYYRFKADSLGIVPRVNLISNIGFGKDATHTFDVSSDLSNISTGSLDWPMKHPLKIETNQAFDELCRNAFFNYKQYNTIVRFYYRIRSAAGRVLKGRQVSNSGKN